MGHGTHAVHLQHNPDLRDVDEISNVSDFWDSRVVPARSNPPERRKMGDFGAASLAIWVNEALSVGFLLERGLANARSGRCATMRVRVKTPAEACDSRGRHEEEESEEFRGLTRSGDGGRR